MTTRRRAGRGARRTMRRGGANLFSVEGLHAAFEQMDNRVQGLIAQGKTDSDLAKCVQRAWADTFHHDLSAPAVRGMVSHYRGMHGRGKTRKAGRRGNQKGGMAPLDYMMGQGTTAPVYGRFPVEISSPQPLATLDMTRFFESPIGRDCNSTGGFPVPTQKGGQRGGGFFDALLMPHMPASVPRNFAEMSLSAVQGAPISNPPPSPVAAQVPLMQPHMQSYDAKALQPISSMAPVASY
jgi:hypothetical protein